MKQVFVIITLLVGFFQSLGTAFASEGPWFETDFAKARLISSAESWRASETEMLWRTALEVQLKAGWKIYWRSPGDAGLPTQIFLDEITRTSGFTSDLKFPVPERFTLFGLETYGYGGRVILPLDITVPAGQQAFVSGTVDLLACSDICVPMQGPLSLSLLGGAGTSSIHAQDIAFARAHVPTLATGPDLKIDALWVEPDTNHLVAAYQSGALLLDDIFIEGAGSGFSFAKPEASGGLARILVTGKPALDLIGRSLTLTMVAEEQAAEIIMPVMDRTSLKGSVSDLGTATGNEPVNLFLTILLIAFLGGLILNVMPCVLPVLSLKIISVLSMTTDSQPLVRKRFLASAAGIIFSFAILAAGLIALRYAGLQVGWGVQFQQPVFLAIIFIVLLIFTLSLFDRITVPMPSFITSLSRQGSAHSLRGDFMAGMLATLLATPCSAPFVGTAITFALTGSDTTLISVMLFMGIGLASPWLLFAAQPRFVSLLPKPGYWMVWLKYGLGVLLLATTIWVGWLFAAATGLRSAEPVQTELWQVWSPEEMEAQIAAGHIILVDVTADWCITCKTNKLLVLDTQAGIKATSGLNIVRLQADWTRPDPDISAFLARYGRYGIPFDIILHQNLEEPVILPEVLTLKTLENSIQKVLISTGL